MNIVTRALLIKKIDDLCKAIETRESVSKWAISLIDDELTQVDDQTCWKVLTNLGAADLPSSDRDYLYTIEDFMNWKSVLLQS